MIEENPIKDKYQYLEEDEEFEEFEIESFGEVNEVEDIKLWQDNWDDEDINEDFCEVLKKQISAC